MSTSITVKCLERATRVIFACGFAATVLTPASAGAQPPNLASAESFAILAGKTVTNTGTTNVTGDVGVQPEGSIAGDAITLTDGSSIHEGDAVAVQARLDASATHDEIAGMACDDTLAGNLDGPVSPGVYCFDTNDQTIGVAVTLTGDGPWIFKIAGDLTTTADVKVDGSTSTCNGSNVFWHIGGAATIGANKSFVGNILAQDGVTLGDDAKLDGRAVALAADSTVTLNANTISACSFGEEIPAHAPIKVTGGGQISVSGTTPASFATYGFNATPSAEGTTGHLNYLNHVTGLHVTGTVTDADVVTVDEDGLPKRVRFSGSCTGGPACTFSVTVEDNGEPPFNDRFGIVVVGSGIDETTADRRIRNGNIQFHLSMTTSVNAKDFRAGDVMDLSVSLTPGTTPPSADAYLVLQLPSGELLSWTGNGFAPGIVPLARNIRPAHYRAVIARLAIPAEAPAGGYRWLSALAEPGTLNLVTEISERRFRISR